MDKKVKEIRAKRLEEYKIERLIRLEDRRDAVTAEYKRQLKSFEEEKKQIKEIEVMPSQEGSSIAYTGNFYGDSACSLTLSN